MSVEANQTIDIVESKRAWRVTFNTPKGGPYTLTAHQEIAHTKTGETTPFSKVRTPDVQRTILNADGTPTAVAGQSVTLSGGKVLTMAEILEAGSLFSDLLRAEDESAQV